MLGRLAKSETVEAVVPSSSAIEVNLRAEAAPAPEAPAPQEEKPTAAAPAEAAPPAEPATEPAEPPRRAKEQAVEPTAPEGAAMPQAALAPAGKRSPVTSVGFFLALVLFAIAGLLWRWVHHHPSAFHLPPMH